MKEKVEEYFESSNVVFHCINTVQQQNYLIFDNTYRQPVNLFLVSSEDKHEIVLFSNSMNHITSIDIKNISCFINSQDDANIFALIISDKPNLMF